jgi:hypothetical protein
MGAKINFKRGTTAQCDAITPTEGEPLYDTTLKQLRMGDGSLAGGHKAGFGYGSDYFFKAATDHLLLETVADDKQPRINSRAFTQVSGDSIGFQSKPSQEATTTGEIYGCQISPRIQDTYGCRTLVGVMAESILKGSSGTISEDVRAFQGQITDENTAGRTISGDIVGLWLWHQLAAHTVSGKIVPISVRTPGGAKNWDAFVKFEASGPACTVSADGMTADPETDQEAGYLTILVGAVAYQIPMYAA